MKSSQQIDLIVAALSRILSDDLIGIYLHGSLAMGCFNPHHSDIDLLVVSEHCMTLATKQQIVAYLLEYSRQPSPIEVSFLSRSQLHPWRYPTPFDLHYSEMWRDRYAQELASGAWREWDAMQRDDADLAAHITVTNARGICLIGQPIASVFPAVPAADYRASLASDIHASLTTIATEPIYAILNCCRTYAYLCDGHIFSKEEGGRWALGVLPVDCCATVNTAVAAYRSDMSKPPHFQPETLVTFAASMRLLLAPLL